MSITPTNLTSFENSGTDTFVTPSVAPTANALILVSLRRFFTATISSVSGNGITYALVDEIDTDGGYIVTSIYRGMSASPTPGSVTVVANTNCELQIIVDQCTGVDTSGANGSGAIGQSAHGATDSAGTVTCSPALTTFASPSNLCYCAAGGYNTGAGDPVVTGYTQLANVNELSSEYKVNDHAPTLTGGADRALLVAVEVKAAAAAAAGRPAWKNVTRVADRAIAVARW